MTHHRAILDTCFSSSSSLWKEFLQDEEDLNILYYPSAGTDLRPFVFSKKECLEYIGTKVNTSNYRDPNFFVFSDYFHNSDSTFFDSKRLHNDAYTTIFIENFCEIRPKSPAFNYNFNREYVAFDAQPTTGKAIFFKVRIESHVLKESFYRYGVYFFYENVNLVDQLFLKHSLPVSHLVWQRDGSGLGGGRLKHYFLLPISQRLKTQYYFISEEYLKEKSVEITYDFMEDKKTPVEIAPYLTYPIKLKLDQKGKFNWNGYDRVSLYEKV